MWGLLYPPNFLRFSEWENNLGSYAFWDCSSSKHCHFSCFAYNINDQSFCICCKILFFRVRPYMVLLAVYLRDPKLESRIVLYFHDRIIFFFLLMHLLILIAWLFHNLLLLVCWPLIAFINSTQPNMFEILCFCASRITALKIIIRYLSIQNFSFLHCIQTGRCKQDTE